MGRAVRGWRACERMFLESPERPFERKCVHLRVVVMSMPGCAGDVRGCAGMCGGCATSGDVRGYAGLFGPLKERPCRAPEKLLGKHLRGSISGMFL